VFLFVAEMLRQLRRRRRRRRRREEETPLALRDSSDSIEVTQS
jgi:hypothetical protein